MVRCPICGSTDVSRIGLYEYECNIDGEVFDVMENKGEEDDDLIIEDDDPYA